MEKKNEVDNDVIVTPNDLVTITRMNHVTEIQYMECMNTQQRIQKLSEDRYLVLDTGEVKEFIRTENRSESKTGLYKTFKKLRYLINNNFIGAANELFVTLTFAPDSDGYRPLIKDTDYLAASCKAFQQRLRRKYGCVEFIRVLEPHEDGHAHYHMLIRFDDYDKIYIPNEELNRLWGKGFVNVHSLKDIDNIGAYVSAYLSDIELNVQTGLDECRQNNNAQVLEKDGKKFIKGGRVKYYPSGTQIYNKSKGIKEPGRSRMKYKNAKKIVGSRKPTFEKNIVLDGEEFTNKLRFESYNSKRL